MTGKIMNIIIGILLTFMVVFFAGSFAYENYLMNQSDKQYEESLESDLDQTSKEHQSGSTNDEVKQ